jgi:hypothetical protein
MFFYNLLDGGPNHSGPLIGPSESLRGGTSGTHPHQGGKLTHLFIYLFKFVLTNACGDFGVLVLFCC